MLSVVYTLSKTTTAIPWCIGGLFLLLGLFLLRCRVSHTRLKVFPFIPAFLILAFAAPAMQNAKIEVTSESFYSTSGTWWSPNDFHFLFRDVIGVDVKVIELSVGRSQKSMRVALKDGRRLEVPIGDLFRAHEDEILNAIFAGIKSNAK